MQQMTLFDGTWISGDAAMPAAGEQVLRIYEGPDGKPSNPIVSTPIHEDGSHILDGAYIYRRTLWWMPIPPLPAQNHF